MVVAGHHKQPWYPSTKKMQPSHVVVSFSRLVVGCVCGCLSRLYTHETISVFVGIACSYWLDVDDDDRKAGVTLIANNLL